MRSQSVSDDSEAVQPPQPAASNPGIDHQPPTTECTITDEPELHLIKFADLMGGERRAKLDRQREESRKRYLNLLVGELAALESTLADLTERAEAILDLLFVSKRREGGDECGCSCPHTPTTDLHDYGFDCPCQRTAEEHRAAWSGWMAEMNAFWESPEGLRLTAAREAEEAELAVWLADPHVTVTGHGGMAPEQWRGSVEDHSFYFRERHDQWRVELDLRPSGRFYQAWTGGDLDDDASFEPREIDEGNVIANGTTGVPGYGRTPVERIRFIVGVIRTHVPRQPVKSTPAGGPIRIPLRSTGCVLPGVW